LIREMNLARTVFARLDDYLVNSFNHVKPQEKIKPLLEVFKVTQFAGAIFLFTICKKGKEEV